MAPGVVPDQGWRCIWCREPIPAAKRADAKHCSKRCRQAHWRFARHRPRGATPVAGRPARLAYADPPYPGKAHLYQGHPDYAGEVDHRELLEQLRGYDGWALSTSSDGLALVLPLCQDLEIPCRVASWHRGARNGRTLTPMRAWEPVLYSPARPVEAAVSDALEFVSRPRLSDPERVIGAKPSAFCFWMFQLMGGRAGDEFADLFPGSGGVARAWEIYTEGGPRG